MAYNASQRVQRVFIFYYLINYALGPTTLVH